MLGCSSLQASDQSYTITSESGFLFIDSEKQKQSKISEKELMITINGDWFIINEVKVKPRQLIIESVDRLMVINDVSHCGSVIIAPSGDLQIVTESFLNQMCGTAPMAEDGAQDEAPQDLVLPMTTIDAQLDKTVIAQAKKTTHVRVLLTEQLISDVDLLFGSTKGFIIGQSRQDPHKRKIEDSALRITFKKGQFYANGERFIGDKMIIAPSEGHIEFAGNSYQGIFNVMLSSTQEQIAQEKRKKKATQKVFLINSIDVEDYIFGVVRSESWPNWPLEVNKVFAIACRSYVIAMAMRAKKTGLPYHIRNTNKHQRYDGVHSCPIIRQAIEETRGVFLAYNNIPILAMFDSCCGGVIPAHVTHTNFADAPYLARDYACTHCKRCKIYSWETSIAMNEFEQLLLGKKKKIGKIKSLKVAKKDKAGLIKEMTVHDAKKFVKLSGKELYSMIKDVKSYCFTITKNYDRIDIQGRGYGHHLGLCQWGAREMVRDGWDFKRILQFYYPGTTFMKLG